MGLFGRNKQSHDPRIDGVVIDLVLRQLDKYGQSYNQTHPDPGLARRWDALTTAANDYKTYMYGMPDSGIPWCSSIPVLAGRGRS